MFVVVDRMQQQRTRHTCTRTLLLLLLVLCVLWRASEGSRRGEARLGLLAYESFHLLPDELTRTDSSLTARLLFNAHGRAFNISVSTHPSIFHPEFSLTLVRGGGGRRERRNVDTRGIVVGHVEGEPDSLVYGHVSGDGFTGVIQSRGEKYHLEPLERYFPSHKSFNTVMYRADSDTVVQQGSEGSFERGGTCTSSESPRLREIQESAIRQTGVLNQKRKVDKNKNTCLVNVVADHLFFNGVGNGEESTTNSEMALHILEADRMFRSTEFAGRDDTYTGFGVAIISATIYDSNDSPFIGDYTPEELLEAFAAVQQESSEACLSHLFTYRDFRGPIGLAYLADPTGSLAGGICESPTFTQAGNLALNTGFTSLLNYGRRLSQSVSTITTAHEIGHNHGSDHDPPGDCAPGGNQGNYIMYSSATDGRLPNNQKFSSCSKESIGRTLEVKSDCFVEKPSGVECGNGVVEGDEECDCGSEDPQECHMKDPCCTPGNCTLAVGALCSPDKSPCCTSDGSCTYSSSSQVCIKESDCQDVSNCTGESESCPFAPPKPQKTPCNGGINVCDRGVCNGSLCLLDNREPCYCPSEEDLCRLCCWVDDECVLYSGSGTDLHYVQSGYPCRNYTGFCTDDHTCVYLDNNKLLDSLRDIFLDYASIGRWFKRNWYWVLTGAGVAVVLMILLHVTYRRKKPKAPAADQTRSSSSSTANNNNTSPSRTRRIQQLLSGHGRGRSSAAGRGGMVEETALNEEASLLSPGVPPANQQRN